MLVMACIGLTDKIFSGRLGLQQSLDQGMAQIGELLIDICGIYMVIQIIAEKYANSIEAMSQKLFFDPSVIVGSVLAADMGAYPLCVSVSSEKLFGAYAGSIIAGTLGGLICFFIPVYLGYVKQEECGQMILGFLYGVSVLSITFIISGILWGIPVLQLLKNLLPVITFCLLLFFLLCKGKQLIIKIFQVFGILIRGVLVITFMITIVGLFIPKYQIFKEEMVQETIVMIVKMGITVSGSLVTMECIRRIFKKKLLKIADLLGVNEWSILGFLVGMPTGIAILPIYSKMDNKGKILNAAFCVSGHYILGGQMALIANVESVSHFAVYLFNKLLGAVLAVGVALIIEKRKERLDEKNISNYRKYS